MSDLIPQQKREISVSKPRGLEEEIDRQDILIPRAKKLEAMSPEATDGIGKPGQIINSITKEVCPEKFIPIFFFKQWIRFNPRKDSDPGFVKEFGPGEMIYRTNDARDERLKLDGVWRGSEPPYATAFLNFFSVFEGQSVPTIISFCNTSYKAGKTLLSLISFSNEDMFRRKYSLTTKKTQNDQGTFFVLETKVAGKPTDEEFAQCESLYNSFRGKDLEVHQEQEVSSVPF